MELHEFILQHQNDDPAELVLHRERWPDVDVALAAECIAARKKLRTKVPQWYGDSRILCPSALSAEQCSSTATAAYKAAVVVDAMKQIIASDARIPDTGAEGLKPSCNRKPRIADLTGGIGVDSWLLSEVADQLLYNEMKPQLREAVENNFKLLGLSNVQFSGREIAPDNIAELLDSFSPDLVFIDPARRGQGGRKVFLPEDCTPDVLQLQDIILERGISILLKLSPMADISLMQQKFHCIKEIHLVQSGEECKELLLLMVPGFCSEPSLVVASIDAAITPSAAVDSIEPATPSTPSASPAPSASSASSASPAPSAPVESIVLNAPSTPSSSSDSDTSIKAVPPFKISRFRFYLSEEKACTPRFISSAPEAGQLLFEPGAALSKSGAFNLISQRWGMLKCGPNAHLYCCPSDFLADEPSPKISKPSCTTSETSCTTSEASCKTRKSPSKTGESSCSPERLKKLGRFFEILAVEPFSKASLQDFSSRWPNADCSARALPINSETLHQKLSQSGKKKQSSTEAGAHIHIFGIGSSKGRLLLACRGI